jgi:hypothetical protein
VRRWPASRPSRCCSRGSRGWRGDPPSGWVAGSRRRHRAVPASVGAPLERGGGSRRGPVGGEGEVGPGLRRGRGRLPAVAAECALTDRRGLQLHGRFPGARHEWATFPLRCRPADAAHDHSKAGGTPRRSAPSPSATPS